MSDDRLPNRLEQRAIRATNRRMGRERADDTEDDEAWDLEYAQAVEDEKTDLSDLARE